eukprot:262759_1
MPLQNLGNTCFLNSVIQSLLQCTYLHSYFLEHKYLSEINTNNLFGTQGKVVKQWSELMQCAFVNKNVKWSPWEFVNTISSIKQQFQNRRQHDACDLLMELLDSMHEDVNQITNPPNLSDIIGKIYFDTNNSQKAIERIYKRRGSIFDDIFLRLQSISTKCTDCTRISTKYQVLSVLMLPIPNT